MFYSLIYSDSRSIPEIDTQDKQLVLDQIGSLDFSEDFELLLVKDNTCLNFYNYPKERYLLFNESEKNDYPKLDFKAEHNDEIRRILEQFINEDNLSFTEKIFVDHERKIETIKKNRFDNWKTQYEIKRKNERFEFLKPIALTLFIFSIISGMIYLIYSEEYKFIAHETQMVNAIIFETGRSHIGRGVHVQKIKYSYNFKHKTYKDYKILIRNTKEKRIGDSLRLKISKLKPKRNKIIGFY